LHAVFGKNNSTHKDMCLFHSWALDAKTKELVSLKCKRRKWAMHITTHLRYGCHFLGMALFRTV